MGQCQKDCACLLVTIVSSWEVPCCCLHSLAIAQRHAYLLAAKDAADEWRAAGCWHQGAAVFDAC